MCLVYVGNGSGNSQESKSGHCYTWVAVLVWVCSHLQAFVRVRETRFLDLIHHFEVSTVTSYVAALQSLVLSCWHLLADHASQCGHKHSNINQDQVKTVLVLVSVVSQRGPRLEEKLALYFEDCTVCLVMFTVQLSPLCRRESTWERPTLKSSWLISLPTR